MADNSGDDVKCAVEVTQGDYFMGSIMAVTGIMTTILVLSGVFHSALRRLGQPSVISHILAGIMVGPTVLGRAMDLRQLGMRDAGSALSSTIYYIRIVFMFFIGLELDLLYLRRYLRRSLAIASSGSALCLVLAVLGGSFFCGLLHPDQAVPSDMINTSTALFILFLTSTASPVLIRVITELKLTGSETGQLAIGAAFANDMASLAALSVMSLGYTAYGATPAEKKQQKPPSSGSLAQHKAVVLLRIALTVWVAMSATAWTARLLNRLKRGRQYISKYELCGILLLIELLSILHQAMGYSASMTGFLIGLAMPREGPTARTIRDRLAYPMHHIIMPLCFGVIGARLDFAQMGRFTAAQFAAAVAFTTLLSAVGKVVGTMLAGRVMGIPTREAVMLGALLNVKGYSDVLAINFGDRIGVWNETAQVVLLLSSIINTFMVGPTSATIVRWQHRAFRYRSRCLQDLKPEHELRMVVCVHGAVDVHPMLTLAHLSKATAPLTVHLLHLIELVTARKYAITTQLYHTGENDDDDEWGYARDIERVAMVVACFTYDNVIPVQQMAAISSIASMDADVRNSVDDARASLVILPFHKELRYDGRMVCRREGRRQLNQRILHRAPCTVGIFVERCLFQETTDADQLPAHQVAAVFLGGADDREAVAYAGRLAAHPWVSVTLCRLRPAAGCPMVAGEEATADEEFMADIHERLVVPGQVSYTEKYVSNGAETVNTLSSMAREFSLFIVGRASGGAGAEVMTCGMGDWDEECPELGPVGELLASDDVVGGGSVLVLQQHSMHSRHKMRTWKDPSCSGGTTDAIVDIYKDSPAGLFTTK